MKLNKKAANELATGFLVLMALVLTGASLFSFNTNLGKVEIEISDYVFINNVYLTENQINFYVDWMMENSIEKDITREEFIENFQEQLNFNKNADGNYTLKELKQVEEQIDQIKIEGNKVILDLSLPIIKNFDDVKITYLYKEKFEKDLVVSEPINRNDMQMFP